MENKKIKGAKISEYNNIKFKSSLECSCYKKLELSGLEFSYESERIVLWEGVKPQSVKIYSPRKIKAGKYDRNLELQTRTLLNITTRHTPSRSTARSKHRIPPLNRLFINPCRPRDGYIFTNQ